ncbi:MAG: hypothetical protein JWM61_73 [Micrococcaceae bacterium]|jgi:hypothetical protein|nr:hypothetical protein [Micrococcaceae bacterium]
MRLATRILAPLVLVLAMLIPSGAAVAASAEVVHGQEFFVEINDCNGDVVDLKGTFHVTFAPQRDGGAVTLFALHAQGVSAQGNLYVMSRTNRVRGDGISHTEKATTLLVSKGSAPNELVKFYYSSTPEGEVYDFMTVCRG